MRAKIPGLKYIAMMNQESLRPPEEIRKDDVTAVLFQDMKDKLRYRELINTQITGAVTTGKSTVAIELMLGIADELGISVGLKNICGDQIEYTRKMGDVKLGNTVLMIDEWNRLGETGLNATTEQAAHDYFSDVQAQRYIHLVSCAPKTVVDPNADVILEVLSADKPDKVTNVLVYFRLVHAQDESIQLCGHARISVARALGCSFYKTYREKKFAKMGFILQEGIRDVREIYHARIILRTYVETKGIVMGMEPNRAIVANFVDKIRRSNKEFLSILTSEDIVRKVTGLLELDRKSYVLWMKYQKLSKTRDGVGSETEQSRQVKDTIATLRAASHALLKNYRDLARLGDKYERI